MDPLKEYYLAVPKEEAEEIADMIQRLQGYVQGFVDANVDPEHGPVNETGNFFSNIITPLSRLSKSLSRSRLPIQDVNKMVEQAKKDMVKEIMQVLNSDSTGLDLVTKLINTLDNYEIIGRSNFKGGDQDEDLLPF